MQGSDQVESHYPRHHDLDWCGEFKAREPDGFDANGSPAL
jgi:hypothetical protein